MEAREKIQRDAQKGLAAAIERLREEVAFGTRIVRGARDIVIGVEVALERAAIDARDRGEGAAIFVEPRATHLSPISPRY